MHTILLGLLSQTNIVDLSKYLILDFQKNTPSNTIPFSNKKGFYFHKVCWQI